VVELYCKVTIGYKGGTAQVGATARLDEIAALQRRVVELK
jgi:hypothetical protein